MHVGSHQETDLRALGISAHDGHFGFIGDVLGVFRFQRPVALQSISVDGIEIPKIYVERKPRILLDLLGHSFDKA